MIGSGAAAMLGTAATTTAQMNDRAVTANVVTDSSGAVALTDKETQGNIINHTNGKTEIDFTDGGARDINIGSDVCVGNFDSPSADPAFKIINQPTDKLDIDFTFTAATEYEANATGGSALGFRFLNETTGNRKVLFLDDNVSAGDSVPICFKSSNNHALSPGDSIAVAVRLFTDGDDSDTNENLSGVLNIKATQLSS